MLRALPFCLLLCLQVAAQEAPIPTATDLPGSPFFIKKTWFIGGVGNWDYLTIDPAAKLLYIAHGPAVQVVDLDSGSVVAAISGFSEAHQIALDDTGAYAYVSDGRANSVVVVDRVGLKIDATIPIACSPRSIAYEPQSQFVFAVCSAPLAPAPPPHRPPSTNSRPPRTAKQLPEGLSHVVVIDTQSKSVLADLAVPGDLHFAVADGNGHVYVTAGPAQMTRDRNGRPDIEIVPRRILKLEASAIATAHEQHREPADPASSNRSNLIDLSNRNDLGTIGSDLALSSTCSDPESMAIDARHQRLFLACGDQVFLVLDSKSGNTIASLTTGPGNDTLAYDEDRGLIFIANGGGYGSVTIVQQDVTTDSYTVIQNLPTRGGARTIAVDSATGEAYLVTDYQGVDLSTPGGIGTMRSEPIAGSFQVLVVAH